MKESAEFFRAFFLLVYIDKDVIFAPSLIIKIKPL